MEKFKKSSIVLYIVCIFIVGVMLAGYFGSRNLKETYGAYVCPAGYTNYLSNNQYCYKCSKGTLSGDASNVRCAYTSEETVTCVNDKNGDGCASYKASGYSCTLVSSSSSAATFRCTRSGFSYIAPVKVAIGSSVTSTCTVTYVGCSDEVKEEDCKDYRGTLSGNTCKFSSNSSDCKSTTFNCSTSSNKYTYSFYNHDGSNLLSRQLCTPNNAGQCTTSIEPPSCSMWSGQKNCPSNSVKVGANFFGDLTNLVGTSNWYCCDGSSGGGASSSSNPIPSSNPKPTPSSSSKPTPSSNPSIPSSSTPSNIQDNPKTGSVAIFIVWIITLATLVYAFVYFKKVRENN